MPDGLYERDVLAWSEHQAELLRRVARGERVNDVDWLNVAEEIEGVGLSELHSVESLLDLMIVYLLKIQAFPTADAVEHWHAEIDTFQAGVRRRFAPSMRQRIDLTAIYAGAVQRLRKADRRQKVSDQRPWPDANPFTLEQLLNDSSDELIECLSRAGATPA